MPTFVGVEHAISCANGTVALHLALLADGVGPGDEVLVPTLTYVATANCVRYCGATPVFVDSEPEYLESRPRRASRSWSPSGRRRSSPSISTATRLTWTRSSRSPSARPRRDRGRRGGASARATGAARWARSATSAIFSFYGNKIMTTGEGGMVVTNDAERAGTDPDPQGPGQDPERRYWFPVVGYNYRLTNVAAAIGLGQMERIDWHCERRRENAAWYREELADRGVAQHLAGTAVGAERLLDDVRAPGATTRRSGATS